MTGEKVAGIIEEIPVVIDHDIIEIYWDRLQDEELYSGGLIDALDDSQDSTDVSLQEKVEEILRKNSKIRGSLEIKYRTYEMMIKNEDNIKNVKGPTFPNEFRARCSCAPPDDRTAPRCDTNKCECRWRSYDDNRLVFDATPRLTL